MRRSISWAMRNLRAAGFAISCALILSGCQTTTGTNARPTDQSPQPQRTVDNKTITKTLCTVFASISWDDADTLQTKLEVKEHNAVYDKICPKVARKVVS
jgi:hypothetical protein